MIRLYDCLTKGIIKSFNNTSDLFRYVYEHGGVIVDGSYAVIGSKTYEIIGDLY